MADQVMRMSDPVLRRQRDGCLGASTPISNDEIQRQVNDETGARDVAADVTSSLGFGLPLDTSSRAYFESRFGHDFGNVRIHDGSEAATAAASIHARAFTLGRDVVFAAGEHDPGSEGGKRLLAHELTHVVQQATPIVTGNAGLVRTRVATPVLARTVDDWLTRTPNVGQFTYTQLLGEIDELNQYLQRQTSSSADTGRIEEAVASLRAEVNRRDVAAGRSRTPQRGRRRGTAPSVAEPLPARYPRILTEMTSVAYTDPSEMRAEYDLIMEWLARPELSRSERRTLTTERDNLAPQLNIDRERVASERHAERVRTALMPPGPEAVNALTNLARTIQDIASEPDNPNLSYIYHQGERIAISREQAESLRHNLRNQLQRSAQHVESNATYYWDRYHSQVALNREHPIIAGISGWLADVEDPRRELTTRYIRIQSQVRQLQARVTQGDMVGAAAMLPEVENNAEHIRSLARAYYEGHIEGAEIAVRRLEFTRNASFAVAGAIAAVVAAPVVAGFVGAGGLGLTGAGATAVTIGGTGLVVGTGVGTVRGTSAAVGTLAAGGSWHDVGAAFTSEGLTGFREGFMSGAGGAAARSVGLAIGVGGSLTRQAAMRVGGEMLINGTTAMANSLWQSCRSERGCNVEQAARLAVIAAAQSVPGALLGGSNNPVVRNLVAPFTAAATSYVAARASGVSSDDALAQAGVALASNIAMSRATHGSDADAALVERGRSMGASVRSTVASAGRSTRNYVAATMIGVADALPATHSGFGGSPVVLDTVPTTSSRATASPRAETTSPTSGEIDTAPRPAPVATSEAAAPAPAVRPAVESESVSSPAAPPPAPVAPSEAAPPASAARPAVESESVSAPTTPQPVAERAPEPAIPSAASETPQPTVTASAPDAPAVGQTGSGPVAVAAPGVAQPGPQQYANTSLQALRRLTRQDPEAVHALRLRYRDMPDSYLRRRMRQGDAVAESVFRQRIPSNEQDLAAARESDYRPPHSATVRIRNSQGTETSREELHSGNMTPEEAALGYPRSSQATHTEARAIQRPLQAGDTMRIDGLYDPCGGCRTAMRQAAQRTGATIFYWWPGGQVTFHPNGDVTF